MKTNSKLAFHDAMAKKGVCVDCHVTEAKAGKKVPAKCNECHNVKG
jgi:cytochrome c2